MYVLYLASKIHFIAFLLTGLLVRLTWPSVKFWNSLALAVGQHCWICEETLLDLWRNIAGFVEKHYWI